MSAWPVEAEVRRELRSFVLERAPRLSPADLGDDTPLLESRLLTSLHVLDLLLLVERLSGRPVDVERLRPGVFRDIETVWRTFFKEATS